MNPKNTLPTKLLLAIGLLGVLGAARPAISVAGPVTRESAAASVEPSPVSVVSKATAPAANPQSAIRVSDDSEIDNEIDLANDVEMTSDGDFGGGFEENADYGLRADLVSYADENCCGDDACDGCGAGGISRRSWVSLDYMLWFSKGRNLPPLVTSGGNGVLNTPDTTVLFGQSPIGTSNQNAGRITLGYWLDDCRDKAVRVRFFANEGQSTNYFAQSDGSILGLPYFDTRAGGEREAAVLVAGFGIPGSARVQASNDVLGGDVLGSIALSKSCCHRLDLLAGYQLTRIDDELAIMTNSNDFAFRNDRFDARNEFHAGVIGLSTDVYRGCWTFSALGKIGLGNMNQQVDISGNSERAGAFAGGLFAQPASNIGKYERNVFGVSPEVNLRIAYDVTDRLQVAVGYTLLYWNRVALAGDHISRQVNSQSFFGGTPAPPLDPFFGWRDTDFWAQSVDFNVSLQF